MEDLKQVAKGINLVLGSIVLMVMLVIGGMGSLAVAQSKASSMSALGALMIIGGFVALVAAVLGFIGRLVCLKTPAGRGFVIGALAFDGMAFGITFTDLSGLSGLLSFFGTLCFIGFLHQLGLYLEAEEVSVPARGVGKAGGVAFLCMMLAILIGDLLAALLGLAAFVSMIWSFMLYVRALQGAVRALLLYETHGAAKAPASLGF